MDQEIEEHAWLRLNTYCATQSEFSDGYESFHAITTSPSFLLYSQTPTPAVDLGPFDAADFSVFWGTWGTWGTPNQDEHLQDSLSLGLPPGNLDSTLIVENRFEGLESSPPSSYSESRSGSGNDCVLPRHPHTQPIQSEHERKAPPSINREKTHGALMTSTAGDTFEEPPKSNEHYTCDRCKAVFSQHKNLTRHTATSHVKDVSKPRCHYKTCDKTFLRKDNLAAHLRRCHDDRHPLEKSATFPTINPNQARSRVAASYRRVSSDGMPLFADTSDRLDSSEDTLKTSKCDRKGCTWHGKGFSTISDRRRHQRDVHGLPGSKGYICASEQCPSPGKIWSRLDNLRTHIVRMHKTENTTDLIRLSSVPRSEVTHGEGKLPAFVLYTPRIAR